MNKKSVKSQEEQCNIAIIGAFIVHLRGGGGKKKRKKKSFHSFWPKTLCSGFQDSDIRTQITLVRTIGLYNKS